MLSWLSSSFPFDTEIAAIPEKSLASYCIFVKVAKICDLSKLTHRNCASKETLLTYDCAQSVSVDISWFLFLVFFPIAKLNLHCSITSIFGCTFSPLWTWKQMNGTLPFFPRNEWNNYFQCSERLSSFIIEHTVQFQQKLQLKALQPASKQDFQDKYPIKKLLHQEVLQERAIQLRKSSF